MREFEITSVERQKKSSLAEDEVGSIRVFEVTLVERQKKKMLRTRSDACGNSKSPWWIVKKN